MFGQRQIHTIEIGSHSYLHPVISLNITFKVGKSLVHIKASG